MRKWQKIVLFTSPLWLYVLYLIVGVTSLSAGLVKRWPVVPGYAIKDSGHDKDESVAGSDGPHVFYKADSIILKSVIRNDTGLQGLVEVYSIKGKDSIGIHCHWPGVPGWNFSTHLKAQQANEPTNYPEADSLIAISDIEGDFAAFRKLLLANGVISADHHWNFGHGHLVLVGDFFDRGLNVTECLWLIYHLEGEAEKAGGKLHFILGNHEIMNMRGDYRYVRNKYIQNTFLIGENYKNWYTPSTELGRWLQTKNVGERIGSLLFAHGGFSEKTMALRLSLDEISQACRPLYFSTKEQLAEASEHEKILFSSEHSPFWYRGYVKAQASEEVVNSALQQYGVSHIIVGHTVVPHVALMYNGKVVGIDTKHAEGISEGLYYSNGKLYAIDTTGARHML